MLPRRSWIPVTGPLRLLYVAFHERLPLVAFTVVRRPVNVPRPAPDVAFSVAVAENVFGTAAVPSVAAWACAARRNADVPARAASAATTEPIRTFLDTFPPF